MLDGTATGSMQRLMELRSDYQHREVVDTADLPWSPSPLPGVDRRMLDGVLVDERGDYPAGTYVRNPPGSSHAPYTEEGCTIFVKLRQFDLEDQTTVRIDTRHAPFVPGAVPGLSVRPLHEFRGENVALVRREPATEFHPHMHMGGSDGTPVVGQSISIDGLGIHL